MSKIPSSPVGARKILAFGHHFVKGKQCFRGIGNHFFVCDACILIRDIVWSRLGIRETQECDNFWRFIAFYAIVQGRLVIRKTLIHRDSRRSLLS